jgi:hypothetical protein
MLRTALPILLPVGLIVSGCLGSEQKSAIVPLNSFDTAAPVAPVQLCASAASTEAAARVDQVGRKILAANPQVGVKPLFRTIGAPQPEIFHRGTLEVIVTEGLVQQCPDEGRLAAVLCHELGRMVAERELLAGPQTRTPPREPPMDVRVGNDYAGSLGAPDQTHLAEMELAKNGREGRRPASTPPPDPQALARTYLTKAGYLESDLDGVAALLREAERHGTFERQLTAPTPAWNAPPRAGQGQTF